MNFYRKDKFKINLYPKDIFEKLEFDRILERVESLCYSPLGKAFVQKIQLSSKIDVLEKSLTQVHEFKQLLMVEENHLPTTNFLDLKDELKYLSVRNAVLSETQIFRIYHVLQTIHTIFLYFGKPGSERRERYPALSDLLELVRLDKKMLNTIKDVMDDEGKIRSDASKELMRIRKAITSQYRDLDRKFNAVLKECKNYGWLADTAESIRNGRRVLAVSAENKRKIKGIILDESGTGSVTYIEPEATLQINNYIFELQQEEKREIYRILKELTEKLRPFVEDFEAYQHLLGLYDFIRAKARLAWDLNAHKPRISVDKTIEIFNARHPLLYLKYKKEKKKVVPLNLNLSIAERILVVSGPNAGGKSVLLKTVGLIQVMLQTGMLVPVDDHSIMSIFNNFFADIGDEQSIENDLSTYSSHLRNMRHFTENANSKTMILMDEFGSGTDPALGGAIAETILEALNKKFCYGIITTHYSNLKVFASKTKGIINGAMTFDYKSLSPKYLLETGKPGSSFAFELAVNSGLSKELIEKAKSKVDEDYKEFDELLTTLQREKQAVLSRESDIAKMEAKFNAKVAKYEAEKATFDKERRTIILEAKQKAKVFLEEGNRKFENMIKEWNENKGDKQIIKKIKGELEKDKRKMGGDVEKLKDKIYFRDIPEEIRVGSHVRLRSGHQHQVGKVVEIRKNRAVVEFGQLKTHAKVKELIAVAAVHKVEKSSVHFTNTLQDKAAFDNNIDVRGMSREDALAEVEHLLDRALMYNVDEVKIIHGVGTGVLRRSIRQVLSKMRAVKSVKDEDPQYGGRGVSIVELG